MNISGGMLVLQAKLLSSIPRTGKKKQNKTKKCQCIYLQTPTSYDLFFLCCDGHCLTSGLYFLPLGLNVIFLREALATHFFSFKYKCVQVICYEHTGHNYFTSFQIRSNQLLFCFETGTCHAQVGLDFLICCLLFWSAGITGMYYLI